MSRRVLILIALWAALLACIQIFPWLSPNHARANGELQNGVSGTIVGLTAGSDPAAGNVGEVVTSNVAQASAIAISNGTPITITSKSLSPGNWDVSGVCAIIPANTTTVTGLVCGLNTTAATQPADASTGHLLVDRTAWTGNGSGIQAIGGFTWHLNLTVTTPVYLVGTGTFGTSTNAIYGFIRAIRTS